MEMRRVWDAWDHRYDQISPGAFRGSIHYTQTGSLGISRNRWERAIHYRGPANSTMWVNSVGTTDSCLVSCPRKHCKDIKRVKNPKLIAMGRNWLWIQSVNATHYNSE
jgi:hypothetical protein